MDQKKALRILKSGQSAYLGGKPGTGKTHLLGRFVDWLQKESVNHAVTASTGIAATHLEGRTIHSFSGLGVKKELTKKEIERMKEDKSLRERLGSTQVIIIDEISMLSAQFIDMLDRLLRQMRASMKPFGGLQVVFAGDFFQLPPVSNDSIKYAFEASAWRRLDPVVCYLTDQYRQTDSELINLLNKIRRGEVDEKSKNLLKERKVEDFDEDTTKLFTHNANVDEINRKKLEELSGPSQTYRVNSEGEDYHVESMLKSSLIPVDLKLKEGAEVMFIKNDPRDRYVNGTRGRVVKLASSGPTVETIAGKRVKVSYQTWRRKEDGEVLAEVSQIPLKLAWAITVHKSQGMTLDEALMDLSKCFVPGQGYVALSRISQLSGLYLQGLNRKALLVDDKVKKVDQFFQKKSEKTEEKFN